jgi:signal transduction histidine kinase
MWLAFLGALAAVGLGILAYRVQVDDGSRHSWAAASIVYPWAFVLAGIVAWLRRPANRLGPLMLASGLALLARQLRYSEGAVAFTVFFFLGDLGYALVGHTILAYPSGRVYDRAGRRLLKAGYATVVVFPLAVLLLLQGNHGLVGIGGPRRSVIAVADRGHAAELVQKAEIVVLFGVLASLLIWVILSRLRRATPRARRVLAPLWLAAVVLALRAVYECAHTFVNSQPFAYSYLFWWQVVTLTALPLALLAGMLRARLARANVSALVVDLDRVPATPLSLQSSLARALGDPSLELFFWLPEQSRFVDAAGSPALPPRGDDVRAVMRLEDDGVPVAALAYDASLLDEPELVDAAAAAARLALENARLHAETRAQLQEVRDSRRRIASAADEERRRIERNLHDGAQQRLLALALALSGAREQGALSDRERDKLLAASVEELQSTIEELRTLARGLHPTVLIEFGLGAALESLVSRSPFPVTIDVSEERFPAEVESSLYFVACEGLNNMAKHSHATRGSISVHVTDGVVHLEIADDGTGGARPSEGSGLQGLADRIEALGGNVRIDSRAGHGTRISVEVPCAS